MKKKIATSMFVILITFFMLSFIKINYLDHSIFLGINKVYADSSTTVITNSFIDPNGNVHKFVPSKPAMFYVYSSDGKSVISSYEAFPIEFSKSEDMSKYSYTVLAMIQFTDIKNYYAVISTYGDDGYINRFCKFTWDSTSRKFIYNSYKDTSRSKMDIVGRNGYICGLYGGGRSDEFHYYRWTSGDGFYCISTLIEGVNDLYLGANVIYKVKSSSVYYSSNGDTWTRSKIYNRRSDIPDSDIKGGNYNVVKDYPDVLIVDTQTINGITYNKSLTDTYIPANAQPVAAITSPISGAIYGGNSQINLSLTLSDPDNNALTCKYYMDSETDPREVKDNISNTLSGQPVSFSLLSTTNLSEGSHTIRFVVSDGRSETSQQCSFTIDKTPPTNITLTTNITESTISVSTSATDSTSGLDTTPYHYTLGSIQSQWTSDASYVFPSLVPNTQYKITVEAKDKVGNISKKEQLIYTKAQTPSISTNTPTDNSLNIHFSDKNPVWTEYQIMFNSMYVNESGNLTNSPVWIKRAGAELTVFSLAQNIKYQIKAKARNSENDKIETAFSSEIPASTLASSPANVTFTPTQTTMIIKWDAVPNAISYNVERDGVVENNITGTSYVHTGLTAETSHSYRISVKTAAGTGSWSSTYTKSTYPYPPETPMNFTITDLSQNYISLTWDTVEKTNGYVIEVNGKEAGTFTATTTVIQKLTPNTQYKFRIKARNTGGDSAWSDYLSQTTWPVIPEIPSNITVRKTNISADVSWDSSERADGYEIEADGMIINTGSKQEYLHNGLTALSAHTYRVRAYNRGGKSEWSELLEVTTNPDKPTVPNNIMATVDKNYTTLTWYLVPYAEKYDIEIDGKDVITVEDLSARINGLQPGTTHTYRVSARNVTGSSDWSDYVTVSTLPEADQSITSLTNVVAVVTNTYITISWDDVDTNAEYEIEVDGVLQDIGKDRVYNHTGLSANQYHTYKVKAKTTASQEYWCAVLSLSTLPDQPDAPTGIEATAYDRQIEIKWNKADDVTYDIEVDGQTIDNGQNNSYTDQNLDTGTEHTYRVRAKNASGVTAWSTAITKSTTLPEYIVKCTKGSTFDFSILVSNVQDFTDLKFVISYNEDDLDIDDLCSFTPEKETSQGEVIKGTKLTITREKGKIIITFKDNIVPGTSWSGELNNILFRAKIDGETKIGVVAEE